MADVTTSLTPSTPRPDLNHDMDARRWTDEFDATFPPDGPRPDRDTMLAWFANAIMCGYDVATNRMHVYSLTVDETRIAIGEPPARDGGA